jgi:hypothetical protein
MSPRTHVSPRAGLTLMELLVAAALSSVVMLALLRLVDATTDLWTKGEQRRAVVEQAAATAELLARDLRSVHGGARGDFVVDWYPYDVERDGRVERLWPRIRLVRTASPVDKARIEARALADRVRRERAARRAESGAAATPAESTAAELTLTELAAAMGDGSDAAEAPAQPPVDLASVGLMEVVWLVLPSEKKGAGRFEGRLWRGERLLRPNEPSRYFADEFFDRQGLPDIALVEEVTGGILWLDVRLATQTTSLGASRPEGGWVVGAKLGDATRSWDAFGLDRPDTQLHGWNQEGAGMPAPGLDPLLPRRIQLTLEIERPRDRERRTRLRQDAEEDDVRIEVENGQRLQERIGDFVMVDGEWLRIESVSGDGFMARRGQRGTLRRRLAAGSLVQYGEALIVEVPVPLHRDDWTLDRDPSEEGSAR